MPIIEWNDTYLTGISQIDEHHRHLVGLFNQTYLQFIKYASPDELSIVFDELIDYATYHFAAEEQLMQESNYPERVSHKQAHDEFIRRVLEMHTDYCSKRKSPFLEILAFLQNWLAAHILQSDAAFGRFLAVPLKNSPGDTGVKK
ncbi:MAG: hypothetical protein VR65_08335 [Desulfobulbaceae bacterium BRH_c16a]|nr:MAG: hypothetical protein VR65_08335 [Desulfobulbaceae bacterium BRH_c16a]